jgi:hypothetical protein
MIDIVDRLRFDATRCELQFSKGVAGNIDAAADEITRLREFAAWVDTWVSNPAGAYSTDALNGLFGMARDKIAALTQSNGDRGGAA